MYFFSNSSNAKSIEAKTKFYTKGIIIDIACIVLIIMHGLIVNHKIISPIISPLSLRSDFFSSTSITLPTGKIVPIPDIKGLSTKDMLYKDYVVKQANIFMALPPDSPERVKKEVNMLRVLTQNNASAADVLFASEATVTKPARAWAMEYLWQIRQEGRLTQFNIYPLNEKAVLWAKSHNIDPRILAIATDTYGPTLRLLGTQPRLFFEAAEYSKINESNVSNYVPNPAVVAQLQMTETGWQFNSMLQELDDINTPWGFQNSTKEDRAFINIGSVTAWDALNLNTDWFPSGQEDLLWIAQNLEHNTGLPYIKNVEMLPGSLRGSGDGSGGAIGPQFMPLNARLFMTWYEKANQKNGNQLPSPNPFNPWTGTMLTYLYLSSEFYHRQLNINDVTAVVRPGYALPEDNGSTIAYDSNTDPRMKALLKWNPIYWEAKAAVVAGEEYQPIWHAQNMYSFTSKQKYLINM
ncbi:MAG: hypothetical protein HYT83_00520 [Candidatus Levybacteria bacterium]|nr:hypothetical protein [Candidatus Levybacteria bacterium]